jgi:hypothetical protein
MMLVHGRRPGCYVWEVMILLAQAGCNMISSYIEAGREGVNPAA